MYLEGSHLDVTSVVAVKVDPKSAGELQGDDHRRRAFLHGHAVAKAVNHDGSFSIGRDIQHHDIALFRAVGFRLVRGLAAFGYVDG
jgi:hypothetical protein